MKTSLLVVLALVLAWVKASADEAIPDASLFTLPKPELKVFSTNSTVEAQGSAGQNQSAGSGTTDDFSLTTAVDGGEMDEAQIQSYEAMNGVAILSRVERPEELGGALGWMQQNVWEPVFVPEVVKLGKVHLTGGIVTAIKRKNPFCLLNPLVFAASW